MAGTAPPGNGAIKGHPGGGGVAERRMASGCEDRACDAAARSGTANNLSAGDGYGSSRAPPIACYCFPPLLGFGGAGRSVDPGPEDGSLPVGMCRGASTLAESGI